MTLNSDSPPRLVDPLAALLAERETENGADIDPLARTALEVEIRRGLATVTTTRTFRNDEEQPIEALLTFPVPSTAVLFRLRTEVAGQEVRASALPKEEAESAYEEALEGGFLAVRHEELLPGIHLVAVSSVPADAEVEISGTWTTPLQQQGAIGRLRIPMTIGRGLGPIGPDDASGPRTDGVPGTARLRVVCDGGRVRVNGEATPVGPGGAAGAGSFDLQAPTDAPVDIEVADGAVGALVGEAADGRMVTMRIEPATGDGTARAAVLVDRSRSMDDPCTGNAALTKWRALTEALRDLADDLGGGDRLELWEFDSRAHRISPDAGEGDRGEGAFRRAVERLSPPHGSDEISRVLETVASRTEAPALLVVTDGKSRGLDTERFLRAGRRLFVVLVGEDSLDGPLARLAVESGGDFFVTGGTDIGAALAAAVAGLRGVRTTSGERVSTDDAGVVPSGEVIEAVRGGARITASWSGEAGGPEIATDAVFPGVAPLAAGLAMARMPLDAAARLALTEGIVSPWTDLLLLGEEEDARSRGLSEQRRGALAPPRTDTFGRSVFSASEPARRAGGPAGGAPSAEAGDTRSAFGPWPALQPVETDPSAAPPPAVLFAGGLGEPFGEARSPEERLRLDAFFPVRDVPLRLPDDRPVPTHRAIVEDRERGRVLGIVSGGYRARRRRRSPDLGGGDFARRRLHAPAAALPRAAVTNGGGDDLARVSGGYRLIKNEEAIEAGRRVFSLAFGEAAARELRPINLTMPRKRTFMHADLAAESLNFALWNDDAWTPFLRVSNSYNKTQQLRFTIGVHRLICANGMIGEDGVTYTDPHRRPLDAWIEDLERKPLTTYGLSRFDPRGMRERLERLAEVAVPAPEFLAGLARALDLDPPSALDRLTAVSGRERRRLARSHSARYWRRVGQHLRRLADRYRDTHGDTAFALLGAASEYASRAKAPGMHAGRVNALQRRCGLLADTLGEPDAEFAVDRSNLTAARRIEIAIEQGE